MPRRRIEEDEDADVNLTPMLDVTFILLIFFIVTATFVKEPGKEITRINTESGGALKPGILIAIDESSNIWINRKIVDEREIKGLVQLMREDTPNANIVIQVDGDSKSGTLMDVQQAVQEAGVATMDIATEWKGG